MSRRLALSIATNDAANLKAVASAEAAARDTGSDDKTLADWNLTDTKSGAHTEDRGVAETVNCVADHKIPSTATGCGCTEPPSVPAYTK